MADNEAKVVHVQWPGHRDFGREIKPPTFFQNMDVAERWIHDWLALVEPTPCMAPAWRGAVKRSMEHGKERSSPNCRYFRLVIKYTEFIPQARTEVLIASDGSEHTVWLEADPARPAATSRKERETCTVYVTEHPVATALTPYPWLK